MRSAESAPPVVLALTGASGAVYALRLLDVLLAAGTEVHCSISPAGQAVLRQELDLDVDLTRVALGDLLPSNLDAWRNAAHFRTLRTLLGDAPLAVHEEPPSEAPPVTPRTENQEPRTENFHYHHHQNLFAPIASGSSLTSGMVVCPCSGGTLSGIAHGTSANLIQRAADVHLKERRKLILVPRETPLSLVMLDNLRRCAEAGAVVLPAMPGWYHGVCTLRDLVDFVVGRVCDQLGVRHALVKRWGTE